MALLDPPRRRACYRVTTRLYAIIGFLALLPICEVAVAIIGARITAEDNAARRYAGSGTIHLERINGLIYAMVMESRGIYLSPNWVAAKPFATNLTRDLAELQEVIPAWQADAAGAKETNIEELTHRLDSFIRFRTELIRVAKEEGPAAARSLGESEDVRSERMTLNRSLETLARAYERETGLARDRVAGDQRRLVIAQAMLAVFAVIALGIGFMLVRTSLLRPLLWLRVRMLRLAAGDLEDTADTRLGAAEITEMAEAVEVFRRNLIDRQRLSRETELLSALNVWLQSCDSLTELYDMVAAFLSRLLPTCSGTLFVYAHSRDALEGAKSWNGGRLVTAMHPEDCWALRRGRTYTFGEQEVDFPCAHVGNDHRAPYCCIPILAQGDTIGLLHLQFGAGDGAAADPDELADQRRLGIVCAEQISLAIANVRLRDRLRDQSIRDPLTGLFNRRYLMETCRREFARAMRANHGVGLLSLDIDHFKRYNDNHGHDAGDLVLRAVGSCLESMFRAEDVPCRYGGEEFVVMLPGSDLATAVRRAEQLRQSIEALVVRYFEQDLPRVTVSVGVAAFPAGGETPEAVLKAADEALYRAKAAGRNRTETATPLSSAAGQPSAEPAVIAAIPHEPLAADG